MAVGERTQRGIHEERIAGLGSGFHSGAHGCSENSGSGTRRRGSDRTRDVNRRTRNGAGGADQRAHGTLQFGGGCFGGFGNVPSHFGVTFVKSCLKCVLCWTHLPLVWIRIPVGAETRWQNLKIASSVWRRSCRSLKRVKCP